MRAESRIKNLTYVIKPQTYVTDAQGHKIGASDSFRIVFQGLRSYFWETEFIRHPDPRVQGKMRKQAEEFLQNHQDNGQLYHIVDAPTQVVDDSVQTGRVSTVTAEKPQPVCVATVIEPGKESRLCGKPVQEGLDVCIEHAKEVEAV